MLRGWLKNLQTTNQESCTEHDLQLAAAALLYEVARADGERQEGETEALLQRMSVRWKLPQAEAAELLTEARSVAENATDYHELIRSLRQWPQQQRINLVADMWAVAYADDEIHPHEEYIIRKVADLLYVSHSDFIHTKLQHSKG